MINFNFHLPTQVIQGETVVLTSGEQFKKLGNKALVITGEQSYIASGAMSDLKKVFAKEGISYHLFDQAESNPSLATVALGAKVAGNYQADFIIGIGGGSVIDTAKGIATSMSISNAVPIIAIPTTLGSGSEVTSDIVLTKPDARTKYKIKGKALFPAIAFLDPRYTLSLPLTIVKDTAVIALSHFVQAHLAQGNSLARNLFIEPGLKLWSRYINNLQTGDISLNDRANLQIAACLAGMAISHTEVQLLDVLSYIITYNYHVPHGRANGMLLAEYLGYLEDKMELKVKEILCWLGMKNIEELKSVLKELSPARVSLTDKQIAEYTLMATSLLGREQETICFHVMRNSLGFKG